MVKLTWEYKESFFSRYIEIYIGSWILWSKNWPLTGSSAEPKVTKETLLKRVLNDPNFQNEILGLVKEALDPETVSQQDVNKALENISEGGPSLQTTIPRVTTPANNTNLPPPPATPTNSTNAPRPGTTVGASPSLVDAATKQVTSSNAAPLPISKDETKEVPYPGTLFKFGSKGKDVERIQTKLGGLKVDGIFGGETQRAVQKFQSENDLLIDGIVGPNTWKKLFKPEPPTYVLPDYRTRLGLTPSFTRLSDLRPGVGPTPRLPNFDRISATAANKNSLSGQFKKKLEQLKLKVLTKGLDITKYLLPDEQVAINFLKDANPAMLMEDINIMIYGVAYNPNMDLVSNFKNTLEKVKSAADNLAQTSQNLGQRLQDNVQAGFQQLAGNIQAIPGQVQSSLNLPGINQVQGQGSDLVRRLLGDINQQGQQQAQQLLQLAGSGITQSNVLRAKADEILNKTSQKYTYDIQEVGDKFEVSVKYRRFDETFIEIGKRVFAKDYKETINGVLLTGRENLEKVLQNEARKKGFFGFLKEEPLIQNLISPDATSQQIDTLKEQLDTDFRGLLTGLSASRARVGDAATQRWEDLKKYNLFAPYPLPKDNPIYRNVQEKKKEMIEMVNKFFSKQEEIFNALVTALTHTGTAIPAITLLVSTPPFNVPAAITLISLVMAAINELAAKISSILDYIRYLQNLSKFVSKDAYKELVRITMPLVELLTKLIDPISALKKFVGKLLEALKKFFKGPNCEKQIRRIKRLMRKRNRELKTAKSKVSAARAANKKPSEDDLDDVEELEEEIQTLQERLDSLQKDCGKPPALEQDTTQLNQILQDVDTKTQQLISVIDESYVYDVQLPDGSNLIGISETDFELLKSRYKIIMS